MKTKFSFLIFFIFISHLLLAQDFRIISSTSKSIIVEYKPVYTDTSLKIIDRTNFLGTGLLNGSYDKNTKSGAPLLPYRLFNIGVPQEFGNTIQILESQFITLSGKPAPRPTTEYSNGTRIEKFVVDEKLYSEAKNEDFVAFDEFGFVRELPVQTIKIAPVSYSSSTGKTTFYTRIVFQVNFASPSGTFSQITDSFLKNVVLNLEIAGNWGFSNKRLSKIAPQPSVLAEGKWVRFEINEEGIYKIDYNAFVNLGFTPGAFNPQTIKIYNNGGYQLSERVNASKPVDLIENAITVFGEEDGVFNTGDYILFYGRGVDFWEPKTYKEASNNFGDSITVTKVVRVKHDFTKKNYYWITYGGSNGKRMDSKNPVTSVPSVIQETTSAFVFKEDNTKKVEETGRLYLGDYFNSTDKEETYITSLNELVPDSRINYTFSLASVNKSIDNSVSKDLHFTIYESNQSILSDIIYFWVSTYGVGILVNKKANYTGTLADNRSNLKISFDGINNQSKTAYLDFFEIEYLRYLRAVSDNITFYSFDTTGVVQYKLSNFSNSLIEVYDVSDYANVKKIFLQPNIDISGGNCNFSINTAKGMIDKYLAINNLAYKSIPAVKTDIVNSNYRGEQQGSEYLIITDPVLQSSAENLRSYRANQSPNKYSSQVYYTDKIFNEFSGGLSDPTAIRDFLKYAYDNWITKPKFVLFLGDGTYDYFGLNENGLGKNIVPTLQTVESLDEVESYPVEDYFARISGSDTKIDLALGRINVHTVDEANNVIDKIKKYEAYNETDKNWRSVITLIGDDGFPLKNFDTSLHVDQQEQIAQYYIPKVFNLNKIYLASYPTNITSSGRRKPAVNQSILDAMNNGSLIISYIGHGSPNQLADENILETSSVDFLKNGKFFFLTAATCDFGKFDAASEESGTEKMLLARDVGIIGALGASRKTYPGPNFELGSSFYHHLLTSKDQAGKPVTIGEAYFLTKQHQSYFINNDERYLLFGDPALRLRIPQLPVNVDSINGRSTSLSSQVKALDNLSIKGTVLNIDNSRSNFNGEALISVFDSEKDVVVKGQDGDPSTYNIKYQGGLIYRGKVSIANGEYSTNFIVPKDISYENKNGKIVTYVYNADNDGVGYSDNIIVGGTNTTVVNDGKGPKVEIYFDNFSSRDSYLVSSSFTLLVKLNDETGLNTTGVGVGHKLEAVINDDDSGPIDLTSYFVGDLDSGGKSGVITYSFSNFTPGEYKIKLKAWDVFNNSSIVETYFTVVESNSLVIKDIVNYPNPFASNTTFTFQHNLTKPINARIKIYTVSGRLIKQLENTNIIDKFVRVDWDGRDEDGNSIANGTYLYKLIVETVDKEFSQDVLGKLSVVR